MRTYIKKNNIYSLFFLHLLFPVLEFVIIISNRELESLRTIATTFAVGHIALVSLIYKRSINPESINYLVSLGVSRMSMLKDMIRMYAQEIVVYTVALMLILFFYDSTHTMAYVGTRLLFALISVPIFLYNMIDVRPQSYIVLSIYFLLGRQNIVAVILISIPVSLYLMNKFKKEIL